MKRIVLVTGAMLIGAAYLAGFWPAHRAAVAARQETQAIREELAEAQSQQRLGLVLGRLLELSDAVSDRNYGRAASVATRYFDSVRETASRADGHGGAQALEAILAARDTVTSAIARTDSSVSNVLRSQQLRLRQAMGYPVDAPSGEPEEADQ